MGGPITLPKLRVAFLQETNKGMQTTNSVAVFIDVPWRKRGRWLNEKEDEVACYSFEEQHTAGSMAYFRTLPPAQTKVLKNQLKLVVYPGHEIIEVPIDTKATWEES